MQKRIYKKIQLKDDPGNFETHKETDINRHILPPVH